MIDEALVALVRVTKAKLADMKGGSRSAISAVKGEFAAEFLATLVKAREGVSVGDKVALFDRLLDAEIEHLADAVKTAIVSGIYPEADDDHDGYVAEEVTTGTLGPTIFDAINELEELLSD